ncbi:protein-L-isoaspartate(D-aspartate) O-methyltransferase [Hujiaoplasma nucleasis]|uniref:Protein-L-isoaspartate O-methyltransferase n=1 Tax=Hujiaoplasma nucleasis TaxID=2725268 RepID=A0A7L6N4X7_9MOLU|nr:protein-L-isoaspartate(D-aspartate) O-methyltransferase [Hujiaoplasma nucleasis]QLY40298.1 protein-L-isoaspartate(D-aspartate) O-methyltransferase [Hujiaoplasma nucleasis]
MNDYMILRKDMVDHQIKMRGIVDERILNAFLKVKRHLFVSKFDQSFAYGDYPLSIGFNQTISQPYIIAYMIDKLNIKKTDRVLEIGTGSGYQTAILAELSKHVYTIEINEYIHKQAKYILKELSYDNIFFHLGNGYEGLIDYSPYDKIIVSCAPKEVPTSLINQLNDPGKLIIPLGDHVFQNLLMIEKSNQNIKKIQLDGVRFVPMVKEG